MEQQLPDTTVLNFGVNGYGQTQELLLLRELLATATPQLIIQVIYLRNDFADNLNSDWLLPRPRAEWHDEELRFLPPPAFQPRRHSLWNGLQRSHLLNLVNHRVNDFRYRWENAGQRVSPNGLHPAGTLPLCPGTMGRDRNLLGNTRRPPHRDTRARHGRKHPHPVCPSALLFSSRCGAMAGVTGEPRGAHVGLPRRAPQRTSTATSASGGLADARPPSHAFRTPQRRGATLLCQRPTLDFSRQ